jgi:bifunctional non-homologous end joining protein LigD
MSKPTSDGEAGAAAADVDTPEALAEYRSRRQFDRTPEPAPAGSASPAAGNRFVVQEHHATALHWDFRLERDGVLVSWATPKGLPPDPRVNHLAVHTEDHPLDYFDFEGEIPEGEYGGGSVSLWDQGTYECEEWTDRKVRVVLHGRRVSGRYALFATGGRPQDWMVHRMDPPEDPDRELQPKGLEPMVAGPGPWPEGPGWVFEPWWPGQRLVLAVDGGRLEAPAPHELAELRRLAEAFGSLPVVLDGVLVAAGDDGRPDQEALQRRLAGRSSKGRHRPAPGAAVTYVAFDLLWVDGRSTTMLPLHDRRVLLKEVFPARAQDGRLSPQDGDGHAVAAAARALGLPGVIAKRAAGAYRPGPHPEDWRAVSWG